MLDRRQYLNSFNCEICVTASPNKKVVIQAMAYRRRDAELDEISVYLLKKKGIL